MPMGGALDAILGMTWWSAWDCVKFYGQTDPKRLEVTAGSKTFALTGKGGKKRESLKSVNAKLASAGCDIEVISPAEGARDIRELRKIAKAAINDHHADYVLPTLFRLAQLNDYEDAKDGKDGEGGRGGEDAEGGGHGEGGGNQAEGLRSTQEGWRETAYVLAKPVAKGRYTAELDGMSQQLQQHGRRVLLQVDISNKKEKVYLINADERDCLYPFGQKAVTQVNAVEKSNPAEELKSAGHQQLLTDILNNKVRPGYKLDIQEYGLQKVIDAARAKKVRSQQLHSAMDNLVRRNHTLGQKFWTVDLRDQLTDVLKEEFDDVIREELKEAKELNPHLEPAYIRLKEDWNGTPPFERCRKMSPLETEVCRQQLQELLEKGMIEPSSSPFGAAVMIIPKPHQPQEISYGHRL
jgi:hypothetical protein